MPYYVDRETGIVCEATSDYQGHTTSKFGDTIPKPGVETNQRFDTDVAQSESRLSELENSDRDIPDPSILKPVPVDLQESLLFEPRKAITNGSLSAPGGCTNMVEREHMWKVQIFLDIQQATDQTWPVLNHMVSICRAANIYRCENPKCQDYKKCFEAILPECEWPAFREWVIEISSCQMGVPPEERSEGPFIHLSAAILSFHWFLEGIKLAKYNNIIPKYITPDGGKASINLFPIFEIVYWGMTFQLHLGNKQFGTMVWGNTMIPHSIVAPSLIEVTQRARERGICLNRLWNVSLISERGEHDLPAIMSLAHRYPELRHENHESCTAGFCRSNEVDATKVEQLHKCEKEHRPEPAVLDCKANKLFFDPDLLRISMEKGGGTAWTVDEPFKVADDKLQYVTISHVWSDGTGVGIKPPGQVNICLFRYFADLVKALGCKAIWWDSISIPMSPDLRTKCINDMHHNYSRSMCTLVHDAYLANFEWADDGSPALALIFSPWFTRGWTAVECNMAYKIKVVYKDPATGKPIIKDLDEDILAKDPTQCSRAHWIASNIIRRLRIPVETVSDLLAILKPRSTSWPRDRMMIAGLLAGIEVTYRMTPTEITQNIFKKIGSIGHSSLLHVEPPIRESGGWSWCPNYLYDLPASPPGEFKKFLFSGWTCIVDTNGTLVGEFPTRRVNRDDFLGRRIIPTSSHPFVYSRVKAALEEWHDCFLIGHYPGPYILVRTELPNDEYFNNFNYAPPNNGVLCCTYLGTVNTAGDEEMYTTEKYDPLVLTPIMIGRDPEVSYNFKLWPKLPSQRELVTIRVRGHNRVTAPVLNWSFSLSHVWMGDNPIYGDLLVILSTKVPHPTLRHTVIAHSLHNLEVREFGPENFEVGIKEEPCISLSPHGDIQKVSKWWSEEVPNFSYVDVAPYWPPLGIPANERTVRRNHIRDPRAAIETVPSQILFRLEFLSRTTTYAAIDNELVEPSESKSWAGIWACIRPDGQYEFHLFHQPNMDELYIVKITSLDRSVPRGSRVIECFNELSPGSETAIAKVRQKFHLDGDPKYPMGYTDDEWVYIGLNALDIDSIDLCGLPGFRNQAGPEYYWKYRRVPNSLLFGERPNRQNTSVAAAQPRVDNWPWRGINWLRWFLRGLLGTVAPRLLST